jgi:hypothetical protein
MRSASAIAPATKLEFSAWKTTAATTMPGRSLVSRPVGSCRCGRPVRSESTTPAAATVRTYCEALKAIRSGGLRRMPSARIVPSAKATAAGAAP